jgi:16S rRNA (guanine(966)-N(2))-methyltransferase RsmD
MRVQLRIVAGSLRGRRIHSNVSPDLRPTPEMVREALFSILGDAVPDRPFFDVFAGTGAVGLEALSRGASQLTSVERDFRLVQDLVRHLQEFKVADRADVQRADAYRWAAHWQASPGPVNVFISPPFADLQRRADELLTLIGHVRQKAAPGSIVVVQTEKDTLVDELPDLEQWQQKRYGRNVLLIWVKRAGASPENNEPAP